jgi:hypothetical protein
LVVIAPNEPPTVIAASASNPEIRAKSIHSSLGRRYAHPRGPTADVVSRVRSRLRPSQPGPFNCL